MHTFPVYCILFCSIIWPTLLAFVAALQEEEENICDSCRPEWGGVISGVCKSTGGFLYGGLQFGVWDYLRHSGLGLVFRFSDRIYGM